MRLRTTRRTDGNPDVIVRKRKYDGSVKSEWEGELLPSPAKEWLVVLHHPKRHRKFQDGAVEMSEPFFLHCFNTEEPLTVLLEYNTAGAFTGAKCDAALPAKCAGDVVEFHDLDLDLIVEPEFTYFVRDRETFDRNRERMCYPARVVGLANQGIELAHTLLSSRQFPFDEHLSGLLRSLLPKVGEA